MIGNSHHTNITLCQIPQLLIDVDEMRLLTMMLFGNPMSNGRMLFKYAIFTFESEINVRVEMPSDNGEPVLRLVHDIRGRDYTNTISVDHNNVGGQTYQRARSWHLPPRRLCQALH